MSTHKKLAVLQLAAMVMLGGFGSPLGEQYNEPKRMEPEPEEPVLIPPPGTKIYYFDDAGRQLIEPSSNSVAFKCFAINYKNAQRKFEKWKSFKD